MHPPYHDGKVADPRGAAWRGGGTAWISRVRGSALGLGLALVAGQSAAAQAHIGTPVPGTVHLDLHVREMATGKSNPRAGMYLLDSVPDYWVTIPSGCTGARRCPLLLALPAGEMNAWATMGDMRGMAERYGIIVIAAGLYPTKFIDVALREALQRFAVDPDKIAITGHCASGIATVRFGIENPEVFSRVASLSGFGLFDATVAPWPPSKTPTQFYLQWGVEEAGRSPDQGGDVAEALRQAGHPVTRVMTFRPHDGGPAHYYALAEWLLKSWATPEATAEATPAIVAIRCRS